MNLRHIRGYMLLVVCGLVLALAGMLVLQQLGNRTTVTILTRTFTQANTLVVVLCSAAAGVVLFYTVRLLISAVRDLRTGVKDPKRPHTP